MIPITWPGPLPWAASTRLFLQVEHGDPVLGAYSAISVARVLECLDLASERLLDPSWGLFVRVVVDAWLTKVPSLNLFGDFNCRMHLITVHLVEESATESARMQLLQCHSQVLTGASLAEDKVDSVVILYKWYCHIHCFIQMYQVRIYVVGKLVMRHIVAAKVFYMVNHTPIVLYSG